MKNKEIEEKYLKMIEELNKKHRVKQGQVDNESYHDEWDDLIVEFLKETGYKKIANRQAKQRKYYNRRIRNRNALDIHFGDVMGQIDDLCKQAKELNK